MWCPSHQHQNSCHEYTQCFTPQRQQIYSKTLHYDNDDELSIMQVSLINDENESLIHCKSTHNTNAHGKIK